jgi:hypothetical protein
MRTPQLHFPSFKRPHLAHPGRMRPLRRADVLALTLAVTLAVAAAVALIVSA